MAADVQDRVEQYMSAPYRMDVYWDEDYWAAEFPDLLGLAAASETWEGLAAKIDDAKRSYFTAAIERGLSIPPPRSEQVEFSGRLMLRLPKSLHRQVAKAAKREGVSINHLVAVAVAKEVGRSDSGGPIAAVPNGHSF